MHWHSTPQMRCCLKDHMPSIDELPLVVNVAMQSPATLHPALSVFVQASHVRTQDLAELGRQLKGKILTGDWLCPALRVVFNSLGVFSNQVNYP